MPDGDFAKVIFWFDFLGQELIFNKLKEQLIEAFSKNKDIEAILVLSALKCGLYSPCEPVAKLCLLLLNRILITLREASRELGDVRPYDTRFAVWFTRIVKNAESEDSLFLHDSVLQSTVECLEMHDVLVTDIATLILNVFQSKEIGGLAVLPVILKQAYAEDVFVVYETIHSLLSDLNRLDSKETQHALEESSLVQDALVEATDDNGDAALRLKCTNLLIEVWLEHPPIIYEPKMQTQGIGSLPLRDSFHFVLE